MCCHQLLIYSCTYVHVQFVAQFEDNCDSENANSTGTPDEIKQEHLEDIDLDELEADFNIEDILIDLGKIADTLDDEDSETVGNDESSNVGKSLLQITMLFLLLWASFYGISATALNHLIQFINYLFTMMASNSSLVVSLMTSFPPTLHML